MNPTQGEVREKEKSQEPPVDPCPVPRLDPKAPLLSLVETQVEFSKPKEERGLPVFLDLGSDCLSYKALEDL